MRWRARVVGDGAAVEAAYHAIRWARFRGEPPPDLSHLPTEAAQWVIDLEAGRLDDEYGSLVEIVRRRFGPFTPDRP